MQCQLIDLDPTVKYDHHSDLQVPRLLGAWDLRSPSSDCLPSPCQGILERDCPVWIGITEVKKQV